MSKAKKFISDCTRNCSNEYDLPECFENGIERLKEYQPWLSPDQARKAVEIAREETIDKIKQFLKEKYLIKSTEPLRWVSWEKVFSNLKQAMKDE